MLEVFDLFEKPLLDEVVGIALVDEHARPDFGDEQADVVIDAVLPADVAGGGGEAVVVGEEEGDQRRVEVVDGRGAR